MLPTIERDKAWPRKKDDDAGEDEDADKDEDADDVANNEGTIEKEDNDAIDNEEGEGTTEKKKEQLDSEGEEKKEQTRVLSPMGTT
jgi:hypothetical protein